ncbi:NUDIX hydrolase [Streptomyces triculaminicus]|uniref:NUDIX hydrolase n=1 Tax=Streptomyces triculaminicus TaxID=2816232 RepID=A0A939JN64_9ACTN|nr:NUDIX hydrolase [Streptomyces triculaminicus]MBO0651297.1 NUDIX hydrolase [Streptomyces triculaminicus]
MLTPASHNDGQPTAAPSAWRTVSRRAVYEGQFIRLFRDSLEGPSAPEVYEHVEVADGVRVVALGQDGRVLLVEDEFYLPGRRMLTLPGGGAEPGEEPLVAARRELEEETGWRADTWQHLSTIHPLPSATAAQTHLFLARGLAPGRLARDTTEAGMTMRSVPVAEAVALVRSGAMTEAGSVTAVLLADQVLAVERLR